MGWARIDDGFHDHPKVIGVSLEALGLWTKCLTWAHRHTSGAPGYIPADLPKTYAGGRGKRLTDELVAHGLWDLAEFSDSFSEFSVAKLKFSDTKLQKTQGWLIHDYTDYLPAAERPQTASQVSNARSEAGKRGATARWATANGWQADGKLPPTPMASADGKPMPPTRPDQTRTKTTEEQLPTPPLRGDVEAICNLLADRVATNGVKRPTITDTWRTAARLLIDTDGYPLGTITAVINWCQDDTGFWAGNIQAMPKLRKQFGQLLVKSRAAPTNHKPPQKSTAEERAAAGWNIVQKLEAAEDTEYLNNVLEIGPPS